MLWSMIKSQGRHTSRVSSMALLSSLLTLMVVLTSTDSLVSTRDLLAGVQHRIGCSPLPLGMEHGHIPDSALAASSTFDHHSVGPHIGRARKDSRGGAWCPARPIQEGVDEWLEVDLGNEHVITATETMGRFGGGQGQEFATAYSLQYWRAGQWLTYSNLTGHNVLRGNENTWEAATTQLVPPLVARRVRVLPRSLHPRTVCMRLELYGCRRADSLPESYTAPPGEAFSPRLPLIDLYDGSLGLLTDGLLGTEIDFTESQAPGWVGWTRSTSPLELAFNFSSEQTFIAVTLVAYFSPDLGILAPSSLKTNFSSPSPSSPLSLRPLLPASICSTVGPCLVSFPLPKPSMATQVVISLQFASKWIILSEAHFETEQGGEKAEQEQKQEKEHNKEQGKKEEEQRKKVLVLVKEQEKISDKEYRRDMPNTRMMEAVSLEQDLETRQEHKEQRDQKNQEVVKKVVTEMTSPKHSDRIREQGVNSLIQATEQDYLGTWVGIAIGILGMAVLFLLITIGIILGKNRRRIFSKHSLEAAGPFSQGIMANLRPEQTGVSPSKGDYYQGTRGRVILPRQASWGDLLSDYQNLPVVPMARNFGSTPMFTMPRLDERATVRRLPPTSFSFSNHLRELGQPDSPGEYGYSAPIPQETRHSYCPEEESFYAASDILTLGRF